MGFFSFGKRVRPKKFDYIPLHYDAVKEDMLTRTSKYSKNGVSDESLAKARISQGLRQKSRGNSDASKSANRSSNIKLVAIIAGLVLLAYKFATSDAFINWMNSFIYSG